MQEGPSIQLYNRKHQIAFAIMGVAILVLGSGLFFYFDQSQQSESAYIRATNEIRILNEKIKTLSKEVMMLQEQSAQRDGALTKRSEETRKESEMLTKDLERSRANESNLREAMESLNRQLEQADAQIAVLSKALESEKLRAQPKKESVKTSLRKDELMAKHSQISDPFTRPRVYLNGTSSSWPTTVTDQGDLETRYYPLRYLHVIANDDLHVLSYEIGKYTLSGAEIATFLRNIVAEKYPNLSSFRIRATIDSSDSIFKTKDSILEGEELMAIRETFELSDILKAEIARQPRPEQK